MLCTSFLLFSQARIISLYINHILRSSFQIFGFSYYYLQITKFKYFEWRVTASCVRDVHDNEVLMKRHYLCKFEKLVISSINRPFRKIRFFIRVNSN